MEEDPNSKGQIVALALKYQLISKYTSFICTEKRSEASQGMIQYSYHLQNFVAEIQLRTIDYTPKAGGYAQPLPPSVTRPAIKRGMNSSDIRRKSEEHAVSLRKSKREEILVKKRAAPASANLKHTGTESEHNRLNLRRIFSLFCKSFCQSSRIWGPSTV